MFNLKIGYFIIGLTTGLLLLFNFLGTLPDGKLHIVFCNVGQGDAAYIRFPDGRDMLVDGGPNNSVLQCLGRHMPFWDRTIDIVVLTHPENDHMQGLLSVLERYTIGYFVRSDAENVTDGYTKLMEIVKTRAIKQKRVLNGEKISIDQVVLDVFGPSSDILGASTADINDASVVFWLRYGNFDALFPGDAPLRPDFAKASTGRQDYVGQAVGDAEVLKFPHHGSKTGFNKDYLDLLKPKITVISVGKNSFGHPTKEILSALADLHTQVLRTDQEGDIEIVSDGKGWKVQ